MLEADGIGCWLASRDAVAGEDRAAGAFRLYAKCWYTIGRWRK
jgi:hypothetical protein